MSNVIQFSITGDTNAEQVAGRAKAAVGGLDKQMDGIGKKFGSGFKDIFLSFLGPMALMGTAMAFIGKMISDNQKKHEDANKAAIEGTNALMSAEDRYYANKLNNEKKSKEQIEEAKVAREDVTQAFLENDPRGKAIMDEIKAAMPPGMAAGASGLARNTAQTKAMQDRVQAILAPEAAAAGLGGAAAGGTPFKAPEGFGNVIGVGANPVLEAMTSQLEEAKRTNDLLATIANAGGGRTTSWLNAADAPAPSRASMLKSK
jgi:hypothetical protein